MVWVVAEGMVGGCLQGEGLVETISREVALIGGGEVKSVGGHGLLRRQVPAAVGARAGGGVFVLLAQTKSLTAVEAVLGQRTHVLLREVALGVAASWQQLLALGGGGREAIRVGRCVDPGQGKRACKKRGRKKKNRRCYFLPQTSNYLAAPHHLSPASIIKPKIVAHLPARTLPHN